MSNSVSLIDGHIDEDSIIEKTGKCGSITPPCKMVILPCNLGDTAYCINGYEHKYIEKFTVEKIVISDEGLVLIDTVGCEWLAKVCYFSLESAEKALKEPVPKASAHNSFFYNRFMKTV